MSEKSTALPSVKRYCVKKQRLCELANELGYCTVTACTITVEFPISYTNTITSGNR